jgi:hypothetical protein
MHDAADHPAVVDAILAAHVRRQMRLDLPPLLIAQPKQIALHRPAPNHTGTGNQQPIQQATYLLGFDPNSLAEKANS